MSIMDSVKKLFGVGRKNKLERIDRILDEARKARERTDVILLKQAELHTELSNAVAHERYLQQIGKDLFQDGSNGIDHGTEHRQ